MSPGGVGPVQGGLVSWRPSFRGTGKPRPLVSIRAFETFDLPGILSRARDVVQAFEQAFLAHWMNVKTVRPPIRIGNRLCREIDGNRRARTLAELLADRRTLGLRQHQGQEAVFRAVVRVDIAEAR